MKTEPTDKQLSGDVKSLLKQTFAVQKQHEKQFKQLLSSNLTSEELEKQQLHREYVVLFLKKVPPAYVNRLNWIKQKIEEKRARLVCFSTCGAPSCRLVTGCS